MFPPIMPYPVANTTTGVLTMPVRQKREHQIYLVSSSLTGNEVHPGVPVWQL